MTTRSRFALAWIALIAIAVAVLACPKQNEASLARVVVHVDESLDASRLAWSPANAVTVARRVGPSEIELACDPSKLDREPLRLMLVEACPVTVARDAVRAAEETRIAMHAWIDLGDPRPQLGFETPFEIAVTPGCREAEQGHVTWSQIEGAALDPWTTDANGFHLRGHTPPLAKAHRDLPWGIVPLSPRTRGESVLEATWTGESSTVRRTVRIAAAARATGIPSIAVGQRVLLGGSDWRVRERPRDGKADVSASNGVATFEADAMGHWVLEDGAHHALALRAGLFDRTPLDCGRSECHHESATAAASSPMTHVLERGLDGAFGQTYDVRCALPCHAVGEPGLRDGGFAQVARELSFSLDRVPHADAWSVVPRALRRLGGVGCTSCHGPAAIPEKDARWSVLRADVCAICHDAPPRYAHVLAWSRSRMARADARPETRGDPQCASCHTTSGFLVSIGASPARQEVPSEVGSIGITCAACHAPHAHGDGQRAIGPLLRDVPASKRITAEEAWSTSRLCIACHSPRGVRGDEAVHAPASSAAAIVLGHRDALSESGNEAASIAPHAAVGSCMACHASAPGDTMRGGTHAFAIDRARCDRCHHEPPRERPDAEGRLVRDRAIALWSRITGLTATAIETSGAPPHARASAASLHDEALRNAAWNILLVLEDPAAGVHNAPYARALLDDAARVISALKPASRQPGYGALDQRHH